jgi:phosphoglycolate phosphatase-like HAD superfamily hydrolase
MKQTLVVFDMDGVLIDVSGSYREAVRQAASLFFSRSEGYAELPDPLFPLEDLALLKQTGGLNNDWDLTAQVLSLLWSVVAPTAGDPQDLVTEPPRGYDVRSLSAYLRATPFPLTDLMARHGHLSHPQIAACYRGDVAEGNLVKGLFQEIYLGPALFSRVYGREPRYWEKAGLIETERLLVERPLLETLAREHLLAIATGRPRVEAEVTLTRCSIRDFFQRMLTLDDCTTSEEQGFAANGQRVSLSKPHPYMLDAIARQLAGRFGRCLYLGDMPDDMETAAASEGGYLGVGVLWSAPDRNLAREALLKAGARHLLAETGDLTQLLERENNNAL